ncbi:MAG: serine protease [Halioglobus sp.]|jgi:serine protease
MKIVVASALLLTLCLTSCGGGGGSSNTATAPAPPAPIVTPTPAPTSFNISGTIAVSSNMQIDGDTNNPESTFFSNNSVSGAQRLPNPVTLGGYVNEAGAGEPGRSQEAGDLDDYFEVELLAGQTITLLVANFYDADADLYLLNPVGELLDFSIEEGEIERISVPVDGTYIVNVSAFLGATNYTLAIGTTPSGMSAAPPVNYNNIIPWQAIVKYRDKGQSNSATQAKEDLALRVGMTRKAGDRRRTTLMAVERLALTKATLDNRLGTALGKKEKMRNAKQKARWETLMTIKALRQDPAVIFAEPNYAVRALAVPNDEAYVTQWHYPLINLPAAWDMTTGVPEVIVAVIDSGILSGHPDLAGQLVPGYDFIRDPDNAGDGNGIDSNPEDIGDDGALGGSSFHGTHVSGTIAAASNNGIGVAGVAWNARIMSLRTLGSDGGTSYDVSQAVRYAAGLPNDSGTVPEQAADIINLSLGGGGFSQSEQALFTEVRGAGVMVVAAAGNDASSAPGYPASYEDVISVSAVDIQRRIAAYSNFGADIDIAAPGGDNGGDRNGDGYPDGVLSTGGSSTGFVYSFLAGTSMAAPHVAGVLALMKSVNADLSPEDIDVLLENGELTDDLGPAGRDDQFGYGLVNAERAVTAALTASGNPPADKPRIGASTSLLNFGSSATTLDLALENRGKGDLQLLNIATTQSWLSVEPVEVDANDLGLYAVKVDRTGIAAGVYSGEIIVTSSINTTSVNVLMSVVAVGAGGDVGKVYLLLIDPQSGEATAQTEASSNNGEYQFQFQGVDPGSYELSAGSDTDNDLFICDAGEACGSYLTADQPTLINLSTDLEDINFPVEFLISIPTINATEVQNTEAKKRATRKRTMQR